MAGGKGTAAFVKSVEAETARRRRERLGIIVPVVVILVLVWLGIRRIRR